MLYGRTQANPPSRFLEEIPKRLLNEENAAHRPSSQSYSGRFGASQNSESFYRSQKPQSTSFGKTTVGSPVFGKQGAREKFAAGDKVFHAAFGEGQILSVKPMGSDLLYEILFDKVGIKKMMATYAKLQKR